MEITPGKYIQMRRVAARLSVEDVAVMLHCVPAVSARARAELIEGIEADLVPIDHALAEALRGAFAFDMAILDQLIDRHDHAANLPAPQLCRECGCSWLDACVDRHGRGCSWADRDLCSACDERDADGLGLQLAPGIAA